MRTAAFLLLVLAACGGSGTTAIVEVPQIAGIYSFQCDQEGHWMYCNDGEIFFIPSLMTRLEVVQTGNYLVLTDLDEVITFTDDIWEGTINEDGYFEVVFILSDVDDQGENVDLTFTLKGWFKWERGMVPGWSGSIYMDIIGNTYTCGGRQAFRGDLE